MGDHCESVAVVCLSFVAGATINAGNRATQFALADRQAWRFFIMQVRCVVFLLGLISLTATADAKDDDVAVDTSTQVLALEIPGADDTIFRASIDTTETPDLTQWANERLAPVVVVWYPKIVALLPSEGFAAPKSFRIRFRPQMRGVAATSGTEVICAPDWFRNNLEGEAIGAVVHELVHVVQQYRWGRRFADGRRPPGWLTEGIPDYIRWFLYEPQSRGAEIAGDRVAAVRYDDSYRVSANFLNWAVAQHGEGIIPALNAALREGRYHDDFWKELTGKTLEELGIEWKVSLERKAAAPPDGDELEHGAARNASKPATQR